MGGAGCDRPKSRSAASRPPDARRTAQRAAFETVEKVLIRQTFDFHDLRHTCVTLLLNLGVPPQVVRDIVGHSDIEVTRTIYAHVSLDDKRTALRELGDALG
ncbi:site-specific integrase [Nonomuraea roseola]|uniref:Tyrosine-type recombinase/integrase n=1 Tax=Nonomuraea roseola TaxID=46179 RepID=A0ABV5Q250_9ACTN